MTTISYPPRIPEDYVMKLYQDDRVSLGMAAELLDKNVHDIIRMAQKRGIEIGATEQQQMASERTADKIHL